MRQTFLGNPSRSLLCGALMLLAAGCGRSQLPPTAAPSGAGFDVMWQASQEVLKEYQFEIDLRQVVRAGQADLARQDPREGLLKTFPATGMSWFELWRKDAATTDDLLESSIQTIYRTATVRVVATPDGLGYRPLVRVQVARSSSPQQQITDASEAYDLFSLSGERRRQKHLAQRGEDSQVLVELPDDDALAARLQADIERRAAGM